jgi:hypothetical protein
MYEASKRFLRAQQEGKGCFVVYLGDHDPSGIDMSRDIKDRLNLFVSKSAGDNGYVDDINVIRVALNMDQVKQLRPPENPAKITDSRAGDYIRRFGSSSWELDAIEPKMLARLVTSTVEGLINKKLYAAAKAKQQKARDELINLAVKFFK